MSSSPYPVGNEVPHSWTDGHTFASEAQVANQEEQQPIGLTAWLLAPLMTITGVYMLTMGMSWVPQAVSLVVVLAWLLIDVLTKRSPLQVHPFYLCILGYFLYVFFVTILFESQIPAASSFYAILSDLKVFAMSMVVANVVRHRNQLIPICIGAALAPIVLLALHQDAIAQTSVAIERGYQTDVLRLSNERTGDFGDANNMSRMCCYALIASLTLFLLWRGRPYRFLPLLAVPGTLFLLSRLGSRTGMAMTVVLGLSFWFFHLRKRSRGKPAAQLTALLLGVGLTVGLIAWVASSPFAYRYTDVATQYKEGRLALVKAGLKVFLESPVIGGGLWRFHHACVEAGSSLSVAHNVPTDILVRSGLIGFLLYYGGWYIVLKKLIFLRKQDLPLRDTIVLDMILLGFIVWHGFSMTLSAMNPRFAAFMMGGFIGYLYSLERAVLPAEQLPAAEHELNIHDREGTPMWSD